MLLSSLSIIAGFALLVWSADRFVDGASATAKHFGMSPLLIGMLIVGFGTSAPEMVVSAIAAMEGNPSLALGNAYGSNIVNIALILGVTAIITPIAVHSKIVKKELPLLLGLILLSGFFLLDGSLSLTDGIILLGGFFALVGWSLYAAMGSRGDILEDQIEEELQSSLMPLNKALFWLAAGLVLLIASSKILVWGAVNIAHTMGVSDLIIGLTVVALGTSLPELAASVMAAKKGEHDIAIGNVVGSNMFNLLAVVGIATVIAPIPAVPAEVLTRDWMVMFALTFAFLTMAYGFNRTNPTISRFKGLMLLLGYIGYNTYLILSVVGA